MVRKIYEFPRFDIIAIYKELIEKGIRVPKWIEDEIKKLIKTRIIYANSSISCCKDGDVVYETEERGVEHHETDAFTDSLEVWVIKTTPEFREFIRDQGAAECEGMGTPRLCKFYFEVIDSEEYDGEYKEEEI